MATIETRDHGTITFPESAPIHMSGEYDAYRGENIDDAEKRLFYVACECGGNVHRNGDTLKVYTGVYVFEINFDSDGVKSITRNTYGCTTKPITHWTR